MKRYTWLVLGMMFFGNTVGLNTDDCFKDRDDVSTLSSSFYQVTMNNTTGSTVKIAMTLIMQRRVFEYKLRCFKSKTWENFFTFSWVWNCFQGDMKENTPKRRIGVCGLGGNFTGSRIGEFCDKTYDISAGGSLVLKFSFNRNETTIYGESVCSQDKGDSITDNEKDSFVEQFPEASFLDHYNWTTKILGVYVEQGDNIVEYGFHPSYKDFATFRAHGPFDQPSGEKVIDTGRTSAGTRQHMEYAWHGWKTLTITTVDGNLSIPELESGELGDKLHAIRYSNDGLSSTLIFESGDEVPPSLAHVC